MGTVKQVLENIHKLDQFKKWELQSITGCETLICSELNVGWRSVVNTRDWPNAGSLLAQRLWRWPNNDPALGERILSAGIFVSFVNVILVVFC